MTFRIFRYIVADIVRGRIAVAYAALVFLAAVGLFNLGGDVAKALVGLLSLVIIVVPLVTLVFATTHFYNSYEFIELLAAQPLRRSTLLLAEASGVAAALASALVVGIGIPVAIYSAGATGLLIVGVGVVLTVIFTALAFLAAVIARDKARGIGIALLLWFYFALLHDGLTLYVLSLLGDFPLEGVSVALVALNPIGLARVLVLLQMDVSALMGYTGAMLKNLLGTGSGIALAAGVLALWCALPMAGALWVFRRKDL